ncbi:hypothetical protein M011DRAFT_526802 [Sporormia fimetaria CBS 119925]|uniref:Uncharacterized protein n=1 Tax=Sporormia fimetaria CBS 119925 TaxID=1340428 RepID=A0A6A6V9Z9_9PLEO|nr:hypothetical protein M011DRAFT_526802 [Sporormia fimetaria CBS 119925]
MSAPELPGFYFDKAKGKYFKITASHQAPPGAKYTRENIRKEKATQCREAEDQHRSKRQKTETIVSRHAKDYLARAYLEREIGYERRSYYMNTIYPGASISEYEPQKVSPHQVQCFDVKSDLSTVFTAENNTIRREHDIDFGLKMADFHTEEPTLIHGRPRFEMMPQLVQSETLLRTTSHVSSLNYLPTTGALVATTLGGDRPPVIYMTDPDRDEPFLGEQFTPHRYNTIWTSSPRPSSLVSDPGTSVSATEDEVVVIAANSDLLLTRRRPSGTWNCSDALLSGQSDVLSLCWLDHRTIAMGLRNGALRLYDTRSNGSSSVLRHPAPIGQIRRAGSADHVVCAGLNNTLMLYDFRAARAYGNGFRNHVPRENRKTGGGSWYIHRFEEHTNDGTSYPLDVSEQMGLVAAGGDDRVLRVWNMNTGTLVKEFPSWMFTKAKTQRLPGNAPSQPRNGPIRMAKFVEDKDGDTSLWAAGANGIIKLGW